MNNDLHATVNPTWGDTKKTSRETALRTVLTNSLLHALIHAQRSRLLHWIIPGQNLINKSILSRKSTSTIVVVDWKPRRYNHQKHAQRACWPAQEEVEERDKSIRAEKKSGKPTTEFVEKMSFFNIRFFFLDSSWAGSTRLTFFCSSRLKVICFGSKIELNRFNSFVCLFSYFKNRAEPAQRFFH